MQGLIISFIAGTYKIYDLDTKDIYSSKARGNLKIRGIEPKVGDRCEYHLEMGNLSIIDKIEKRKNDLIRPCVCNIDQAIVVFSVKEPDLNLNLLDKFLVTLEYYQIIPIIVFNKWDLLNKEEEIEILKIKEYYESIGYKVISTSTENIINIDSIKVLLKDKITVFTGQSGVGKSSIINVLDPSFNLETQEISTALGRGKHTTRHTEFYPYLNGFMCDTPGFGTIDFYEFDEQSLENNFVELFKYGKECFYHPCTHTTEPKCMVKENLNKGLILKSRYENYVLFLNDIKNNKKRYVKKC